MPDSTSGTQEQPEHQISPWWLLVFATIAGAAVSAAVNLIASEDLSLVEWVGTTATIAAVVIAVGIYRLQERESSEAHSELMEQLEAQSELLEGYAEKAEDEAPAGAKAEEPEDETPERGVPERGGLDRLQGMRSPGLPTAALSPEQRAAVEATFGDGSIDVALDPVRGRARGGARLVRLNDGRLVSVFSSGRGGGVRAREVGYGRRGGRGPR